MFKAASVFIYTLFGLFVVIIIKNKELNHSWAALIFLVLSMVSFAIGASVAQVKDNNRWFCLLYFLATAVFIFLTILCAHNKVLATEL